MPQKPTTRRELKRLDSKKIRAAERAALSGAHERMIRTRWYTKDDRQPFSEVQRVTKKRKKRQLEYCPRRQHEGAHKRHYYIRTESERVWLLWNGTEFRSKVRGARCMYCGRSRRR